MRQSPSILRTPMAGSQSNSRKKVPHPPFRRRHAPGYLARQALSAMAQSNCSTSAAASSPYPSTTSRSSATSATSTSLTLSTPERLTRRGLLAPSAQRWASGSASPFRSGDLLEGLAPTDRSLLDALVDDAGLFPHPARHPLQHPAPLRPPLRHRRAPTCSPSSPLPPAAKPLAKPAKESLQEELFHLPLDPRLPPPKLSSQFVILSKWSDY